MKIVAATCKRRIHNDTFRLMANRLNYPQLSDFISRGGGGGGLKLYDRLRGFQAWSDKTVTVLFSIGSNGKNVIKFMKRLHG